MKRNILMIFITLLMIFFLFTYNEVVANSIISSFHLFLTKVFICLFPMYLLTKILINFNFPYYIGKLTHSNYIYIFFLSLFVGTPNNAVVIKDLYEKKIITLEEANQYIMANFFINPLFLYTMLNNIFPIKITICLLLISYSSNIILYFFHKKNYSYHPVKIKEQPIGDLLVQEINNASKIFLNVLGMIIVFNLLSLLLPKVLFSFVGILEVTNGLAFLSNFKLSIIPKALLTLIYINFGGICIAMQIKSVLKDTPIDFTKYLYARFYAVFISLFLFLCISSLLL